MVLTFNPRQLNRPEFRVEPNFGEVAERFNALVLKTSVGESPPWVQIPPSPPDALIAQLVEQLICNQ